VNSRFPPVLGQDSPKRCASPRNAHHRGLKTGRNRNFDGIFTERHHNYESISPTSHGYVEEARIRPTQEIRSFRELVAHMIADHDTHIG
jgi:hypothetical protein